MNSAPAQSANCREAKDDRPPVLDPPPLDILDQPPVDRYCDVVLTGGVTDGVVYPWAVMELARKFRFNSIGGTSVGAMAAALTAAAEYSRRHGSVAGFNEVLLKLPRKLGECVGENTRLFSLFQPVQSTRRLFQLFVDLFAAKLDGDGNGFLGGLVKAVAAPVRHGIVAMHRLCKDCKVCAIVLEALVARRTCWICDIALAVLGAYRRYAMFWGLIGLSIGLTWWWPLDCGSAWALLGRLLLATPTCHPVPVTWALLGGLLLSALPCAMVFVAGAVLIAIYRDLIYGLAENGFGLCTGYRNETTPAEQQSLIEWLHEGIQGAAGKPLDQPLTFKDLWDAPGGPAGRPLPPTRRNRKSRSIDLRMVTTNLTHWRPYGLPFDDETSRLFFKRKDLEVYFPPAVLDHLERHSSAYACKVPGVDPDPKNVPNDLLELPAGDFPVVVAARLSLSFPVLFSAVPLWAIDYEPPLDYNHKPPLNPRTLRQCWFSDGGICSNFPVHLFDAALPQWPTFGIVLVDKSIFWNGEPVWMPVHYNEGRGDRWDRFGDKISLVTGKPVPPLTRLLGFVHSIFWSAKDWKDKTSMRMPGVRDRVVRVNLNASDGGLNLKLTGNAILKLANDYGLEAGKALIQKFIDPAPGNPPSQAWDEHRWVRFNTLLVGLRERIEAITAAAELTSYAKPISEQIAEAVRTPPLSEGDRRREIRLTPEQANDLQHLLAALKDLESKFAQAQMPQPYTPLPTPSMRIRPPL